MGTLLSRGISPIIAGLIVAIVVASGLGFYVYWARQQLHMLPQRPPEPCPAAVMAVANGSTYILFAVFAGDMAGESLYVVVINASTGGSPAPPQATSTPVSTRLSELGAQDIAKLTSNPAGFDMIFSEALPPGPSYTLENLTLATVRQAPWYSGLQHNEYYAVELTLTASPKTSALYTFRLTGVGALEILAIDAVGGYVIDRAGFYTSNPADLKQVNGPVELAVALRSGSAYSIAVRQVFWYQQAVDQQSPYLWLEVVPQPQPPSPATPQILSKYFAALEAGVVAVPGGRKGHAFSTAVKGIPVYWVCRGFIAPVQR